MRRHVLYRVRPGSDEWLALLLAATLCASAPAALLGVPVPAPTFLPAGALVVLAVMVVAAAGASSRRVRDVPHAIAAVGLAAALLLGASTAAGALIGWRANAWFAPAALYEASAIMLAGHVVGIACARLGPRLPARFRRFHARPLDLGASAERLARAMVRAALVWLAVFWLLVAVNALYVSAIVLLIAAGSVALGLPLRLVVGAFGVVVPVERGPRTPHEEGTRRALHA